MAPSSSPSDERNERAVAIHRESLQLIALIAIAIAAFFATRAVATSNRETGLRDAAEWYRRGQLARAGGHLDEAVDDFRRATVRNRANAGYVLSLARALALKRDLEGARAALLSLRDTAPEDPEVNLELARLAADGSDVDAATRFYHNALYAPWPAEAAEERRSVRLELIEFLLTHGQTKRAVSELVALSADLPDDPPHHLRVARLFARAGDPAAALSQYEAALVRDPDSGEALAGAGQSAFQLGDYVRARQYLRRALPGNADVRSTLDVANLVISQDPLANRIGAAERRRRLQSNLDYSKQRNLACAGAAGPSSPADAAALAEDISAFEDALKASPLEQDTIENGVDLIARVERRVEAACDQMAPLDRALVLIAVKHGAGGQ